MDSETTDEKKPHKSGIEFRLLFKVEGIFANLRWRARNHEQIFFFYVIFQHIFFQNHHLKLLFSENFEFFKLLKNVFLWYHVWLNANPVEFIEASAKNSDGS